MTTSQTEIVPDSRCPFCNRSLYRKTNVPANFNLLWYCSGCYKRANNCECIPLGTAQLTLAEQVMTLFNMKAERDAFKGVSQKVAALESHANEDSIVNLMKAREPIPCPLCTLPMRNYESDKNKLLYICKAHKGYPTLSIEVSGLKTAKGILPYAKKRLSEATKRL